MWGEVDDVLSGVLQCNCGIVIVCDGNGGKCWCGSDCECNGGEVVCKYVMGEMREVSGYWGGQVKQGVIVMLVYW